MNIDTELLRANVKGIGPAIANALEMRYQTWEALSEAPRSELEQINGFRKSAVTDVVNYASAMASSESLEEERRKPAPADSAQENKGWILREQRPDKNTVLRTRHKMDDATCPHCAINFAEAWFNRPYEEVSAPEQAKIKAHLRIHIAQEHGLISKRIISEEEMVELSRGEKVA